MMNSFAKSSSESGKKKRKYFGVKCKWPYHPAWLIIHTGESEYLDLFWSTFLGMINTPSLFLSINFGIMPPEASSKQLPRITMES